MAAFIPLIAAGANMAYDKWGKSDKMQKIPTMTKEQQNLLSQMMQMIGQNGNLGQGNNEGINYQRQLMDPSSEAVRQFTQPYVNEFEQQTVPGLAERFAGMGGMGGGLSSSGFGQSLSSAGGNLQSQLAQLKAMLGQQAGQSLMGQYGQMAQGALSAQPFGYAKPQQTATGGFLQSWGQNGFPGLQNPFGGGNGGNQFPLTAGYDQQFRQGGVF